MTAFFLSTTDQNYRILNWRLGVGFSDFFSWSLTSSNLLDLDVGCAIAGCATAGLGRAFEVSAMSDLMLPLRWFMFVISLKPPVFFSASWCIAEDDALLNLCWFPFSALSLFHALHAFIPRGFLDDFSCFRIAGWLCSGCTILFMSCRSWDASPPNLLLWNQNPCCLF